MSQRTGERRRIRLNGPAQIAVLSEWGSGPCGPHMAYGIGAGGPASTFLNAARPIACRARKPMRNGHDGAEASGETWPVVGEGRARASEGLTAPCCRTAGDERPFPSALPRQPLGYG